jgi:hypothetical protein
MSYGTRPICELDSNRTRLSVPLPARRLTDSQVSTDGLASDYYRSGNNTNDYDLVPLTGKRVVSNHGDLPPLIGQGKKLLGQKRQARHTLGGPDDSNGPALERIWAFGELGNGGVVAPYGGAARENNRHTRHNGPERQWASHRYADQKSASR